MMFDDTIKLYATSADDHQYGDEDDHDDSHHRFEDDDEEEEVTMTSDDDEEIEIDDDGTVHETHVEEAVIFAPLRRQLPAMRRRPNPQDCR